MEGRVQSISNLQTGHASLTSQETRLHGTLDVADARRGVVQGQRALLDVQEQYAPIDAQRIRDEGELRAMGADLAAGRADIDALGAYHQADVTRDTWESGATQLGIAGWALANIPAPADYQGIGRLNNIGLILQGGASIFGNR